MQMCLGHVRTSYFWGSNLFSRFSGTKPHALGGFSGYIGFGLVHEHVGLRETWLSGLHNLLYALGWSDLGQKPPGPDVNKASNPTSRHQSPGEKKISPPKAPERRPLTKRPE